MKPKKSRSAKAVKKASRPASPSPAPAAQPKVPRPRRPAARPKASPKLQVPQPVSAKAKAPKPPKKAAAKPARQVAAALLAKALEPSLPPAGAPAGGPPKPEKKPTPGKPTLKVPPILLEGDEPSAPLMTGPGQKFALGPTPPALPPKPQEGELPEAYGTGRLFLTARDPHCLYAHWDITAEQQRRYNVLSVHRHLMIRVFLETLTGRPITELPVHPESTHWFIHVDRAGARYAAELGYYQPDHQWRTIATAEPVLAPPETVAGEKAVQFATISPDVPLTRVPEPELKAPLARPEPVPVKIAPPVAPPQQAALPTIPAHPGLKAEPVTPAQAPAEPMIPAPVAAAPQALPAVKSETEQQLTWKPAAVAGPPGAWTAAQERALAEMVSTAFVRQEWVGSMTITELIRRQAAEEIGSIAAAQLGAPAPAAVPVSISSPMGEAAQAISSPMGEAGLARGRGFWFNVNAELVIYGATEPDAKVSIGGRQIRLRPDGTFSYRFALPDGEYVLPIAAMAVDGEVRRADLDFHRATQYDGEVGAHPQDPALKTPQVENVS